MHIDLPFREEHPDGLAIYCSDGRYTRAVEELALRLGKERVDALCLPGGPGLLNPWTSSGLEADSLGRSALFLIEKHHVDKVFLVAHAGCGYYRVRYPDLPDAERKERQIRDLQEACGKLASPRWSVLAFYVTPGASGGLDFQPVPP